MIIKGAGIKSGSFYNGRQKESYIKLYSLHMTARLI